MFGISVSFVAPVYVQSDFWALGLQALREPVFCRNYVEGVVICMPMRGSIILLDSAR